MKQKADDEDDNDSQQREDQWVGKPPLTPVREAQPEANHGLFLSYWWMLSGHGGVLSVSQRILNEILTGDATFSESPSCRGNMSRPGFLLQRIRAQ